MEINGSKIKLVCSEAAWLDNEDRRTADLEWIVRAVRLARITYALSKVTTPATIEKLIFATECAGDFTSLTDEQSFESTMAALSHESDALNADGTEKHVIAPDINVTYGNLAAIYELAQEHYVLNGARFYIPGANENEPDIIEMQVTADITDAVNRHLTTVDAW
jgi:hypothetical protein